MRASSELLQGILKGKDIRLTWQREAILKILYETPRPLTAGDIYLRLMDLYDTIRLSTVYRNLNLFVKKDVLRKIELNINNKESFFEFVQGEHHHHLICVKCNEILPLDCPLKKYEEELVKDTDYAILDHKVKIYGICPKCKE